MIKNIKLKSTIFYRMGLTLLLLYLFIRPAFAASLSVEVAVPPLQTFQIGPAPTSQSGGGGSGSGTTVTSTTPGSVSTSTPTDLQSHLNSLLSQLAALQEKLAGLQGKVSTGFLFVRPLYFGLKHSDVAELQKILKSQGMDIYPEGLVTGYFGALTKRAVQRFQLKHSITTETDSAFGYVGPKTRAKLNNLLGF